MVSAAAVPGMRPRLLRGADANFLGAATDREVLRTDARGTTRTHLEVIDLQRSEAGRSDDDSIGTNRYILQINPAGTIRLSADFDAGRRVGRDNWSAWDDGPGGVRDGSGNGSGNNALGRGGLGACQEKACEQQQEERSLAK